MTTTTMNFDSAGDDQPAESKKNNTAAQAGIDAIPLVEMRDIERTYITGGGAVVVHALKKINLKIYPGEFVAIVGQSGSGKSTMMNILGCLDKASSGTYLFAGRNINSFEADDLAWLRREAFGFVFQSYNLLTGSSAEENVEVPAIYAGLSHGERRIRAEALLTSLGLGERMDHKPNQLSGGQQQRVSIARALMNGGKIILADEPTGALDSQSGIEVMELMKDLARKGHTVILITHDPKVAENADRVIEFLDGEIKSDSGHAPGAINARSNDELRDMFMSRKAASIFGGIGEAVRMALKSLHTNLLRTALTLLGIVFGVASVIAMLAIGEGSKQQIYEAISSRGGANLFNINPGSPDSDSWRDANSTLTVEDARAIEENIGNLLGALPQVSGNATLRYQTNDTRAEVIGTGSRMPQVRKWEMARGIFFSDQDSEDYATVAVLGDAIYRDLFPEGDDPLGKYMLVGNTPFQIIGTMTQHADDDMNEAIFVPVKSAALRLFGEQYLNRIEVWVDDTRTIDKTQDDVVSYLITRHGTQDFRIWSSAEMLESANETNEQITNLLGAVAAISLLVGGIGVMNIMLMSVTERTREIGIRMATGARQKDILSQFLIEAIVVSCIGGVLGVGLGVAVGQLLPSLGEWNTAFTLAPIILAFSCAAATGIVFGYAPARKASRMDPVEALSNE